LDEQVVIHNINFKHSSGIGFCSHLVGGISDCNFWNFRTPNSFPGIFALRSKVCLWVFDDILNNWIISRKSDCMIQIEVSAFLHVVSK
jgi:hypothetical protein